MKKPTKKPKKPTVKTVTYKVKTDWPCKQVARLVADELSDMAEWYNWKLHRKVQVRDEGER